MVVVLSHTFYTLFMYLILLSKCRLTIKKQCYNDKYRLNEMRLRRD